MQLLFSNILPLKTTASQKTIADSIIEEFAKSDHIEIAVGYVSLASLEELDRLTELYRLKNICLTIGMYYIDGMPEKTYRTAIRINKKWIDAKIGEIRIVKAFKYHGKNYCFYRNGKPFSAIMGSANLGVIKPEANNRRQYETAVLTTDYHEVNAISEHIISLKSEKCSDNIKKVSDISLVHEINTSLTGIELVNKIPQSDVDYYRNCNPVVSFCLPLKVPKAAERHMDDNKHYTKSNINVCYAAPRNKKKPRDWYETQLTVSSSVYKMDGYPKKNTPFFVITDDGYSFKAHTTSDNNKQFSAVGDELIMGRWLKGRLAAAGLVTPVNDTQMDVERKGMITQEMLQEYGCDQLVFKKTGKKSADSNGEFLDVWFLSFEPTVSK